MWVTGTELSGRILLFVRYGNMRFKISLSKIFDKKGKRLIGLNEVRVSNGLLGLGKIIILKNFHYNGNYDSLRAALYNM